MGRSSLVAALFGMIALLPALALAASPGDGNAALDQVQVNGTVLSLSTAANYQSAVVRVTGPKGYALVRKIAAGSPLAVDLLRGQESQLSGDRLVARSEVAKTGSLKSVSVDSRSGSSLPDGQFHYEVVIKDASGARSTQEGLFFVQHGMALSRDAMRTQLGDTREKLAQARAAISGPRSTSAADSGGPVAQAAGTFDDEIFLNDLAQDNNVRLRLDNDGTGIPALYYWDVADVGDTFSIWAYSAGPSYRRMTITRSGNVGIGTGTPGDRLDIYSTSSYAGVRFENYGGSALYRNRILTDTLGRLRIQVPLGSSSVTITPGRVGIASVVFNPSAPLEVQGKNGSGVNTVVNGGSLVVTRGDSTPNIRFLKTAGTDQSWLFQNNTSTGVFAIRDETGGKSPVQIYPGAGAQLLQLQGTHVNVNGQIWQRGGVLHADYVFDPSYRLQSIADHAEFMWAHKHLPAIAGVKKDRQGREMVNLGAQQRGIVEELEKAHIYIAQLNNENVRLNKELAATKEMVAAQTKAQQMELDALRAKVKRLEQQMQK